MKTVCTRRRVSHGNLTFPLHIDFPAHYLVPSLPPSFLSVGYRVFAVDLLGFGGSDKVKEGVDYELELWRDLLVDFMEVSREEGREMWE